MNAFEKLHPSLQYHVVNTLGWSTLRPTQLEAITPIHDGSHCLLLAPTAGGKTEAAVIPVLSKMLNEAWSGTSVLYICPIKALLNNLEPRLSHYAGMVGRRVEVWHGDISQSRKNKALRDAPDILLTTPESIEAMLISIRVNRPAWFGNLRAVVVDELHAFASDDRGWHLRSVLHRLDQYLDRPLQRIGLSATVSNPTELLNWFAPYGDRTVVGSASVSTVADVTIDHVASLENAATVISRLHRGEKRLVFCDSRSVAEQLSSMLRSKQIRTFVSHASLSISERKQAEAAFTEEKDCVIVATSTLELGIDVGDLDRVIQIDSPSSVSSFLQRMGRTGRRHDSMRNCLFLTTNDDAFMLSLGVVKKWSEAWVEAAVPPAEPWNIVAQQALVAVLEHDEIPIAELVALLCGAFPELAGADVLAGIDFLIDEDYLVVCNGVINIGEKTEQTYGRGHYRDLLASFSGSTLLTGRHGSSEVGFIDPTALTGEKEDRKILLAGRSWQVTDVDWSKRIAWLEPAKEGGKARWLGGARSLSQDICQAIKSVLAGNAIDNVYLSKRSKDVLQYLMDELPVDLSADFLVMQNDLNQPRIWNFAGTNINRTLSMNASNVGQKIKFDALSIYAPLDTVSNAKGENLILLETDISALSKGTKFSDCIPFYLLEKMVKTRLFSPLL